MAVSWLRSLLLRGAACLAFGVPLLLVVAGVSHTYGPAFAAFVARLDTPMTAAPVVHARTAVLAPSFGMSVLGPPSLSPGVVNAVLSQAGSPAQGTGQALYDLSVQSGIDDAYALAVFQHESTYGLYGAGSVNHALGNIDCAGYPTCDGRFRFYSSWEEGYADFYRLLVQEYVSRGLSTVESITPVYAPSVENDVSAYIQSVVSSMQAYRALQASSKEKGYEHGSNNYRND